MGIQIRNIGHFILMGVLSGMLAGCLGGGSGNSGSGTQVSEIRLSALGAHISGLTATLEITGMGTYPMTVNSDDTVAATVAGLAPGFRTFTVIYYADGVVLARVSRIAEVVSGQNVVIMFTRQELDRDFDDDFDGWVNLAEVLWGTEPLLAASRPLGDSPYFVASLSGGQSQSASYVFQDTLGEGISTGASTSSSYALESGFQAYD